MLVINEEHHSQLHQWIMETTAPCNLQIIESNSKRALCLVTAAILARHLERKKQRPKKKNIAIEGLSVSLSRHRSAILLWLPYPYKWEKKTKSAHFFKHMHAAALHLSSRNPHCIAFECLCSLYWCGAVTRHGSIRHAVEQLMAQHHQRTWPSVGEFY